MLWLRRFLATILDAWPVTYGNVTGSSLKLLPTCLIKPFYLGMHRLFLISKRPPHSIVCLALLLNEFTILGFRKFTFGSDLKRNDADQNQALRFKVSNKQLKSHFINTFKKTYQWKKISDIYSGFKLRVFSFPGRIAKLLYQT